MNPITVSHQANDFHISLSFSPVELIPSRKHHNSSTLLSNNDINNDVLSGLENDDQLLYHKESNDSNTDITYIVSTQISSISDTQDVMTSSTNYINTPRLTLTLRTEENGT